jgi:hypothetical protein
MEPITCEQFLSAQSRMHCYRPFLHVTHETALSNLLVEGSSLFSAVISTHRVLQLSTGCVGLANPLCMPWASAGHTTLFWLGMTAYSLVQLFMPATWPAAEVHLLPMLLVRVYMCGTVL